VTGLLSLAIVGAAPSNTSALGYTRTVSWHVDGEPEVADMQSTIHDILTRVHVSYPGVDGQTVEGFFPGTTYSYYAPGAARTPFYLYTRDTATILPIARFYFPASALRSAVEEFLRQQYPDGGISATVSPDHSVDKATTVSDEEASCILAAAEVFRVSMDAGWLRQSIRGQSVVDRLNRAMLWVLTQRRDPDTRLIKRAHTTDWGDVKWEPTGDPAHVQPGDQWTASIYDQSIAYGTLQALAGMNAAVGRDQDAARWQAEAADIRAASNMILWQDAPDRGFYRIHVHLGPNTVEHDFDEGQIVAIGNAAAVYYGLAEPDKVPRILDALGRAQLAAGSPKPGLTLDQPYTGWPQAQMDERVYQNGAVWDWWGGRQISAEFWSGYSHRARQHLLEVARDWATHPGAVREWESPWLGRTGVDQAYAGAATAVGQAVVEGLFGVEFLGHDVHLSPRLGFTNGGIRVYEPATDVFSAYEYTAHDRQLTLSYGSNTPTPIAVHLRIPWGGPSEARLDQQDVLPITYERVGEELVASVLAPSGTHRIDLEQAVPDRPEL
jgi:hypothetical protein